VRSAAGHRARLALGALAAVAAIAAAGCGGDSGQETGSAPAPAQPSAAGGGDAQRQAQESPQASPKADGAPRPDPKAGGGKDDRQPGGDPDRKAEADSGGRAIERIVEAAEDQGVAIVRGRDGDLTGPVGRIVEKLEERNGPAARGAKDGKGLAEQVLEELNQR